MQKLVIGMTHNRGFTLIEILIVIVIIGITVGFALLSFGDFGSSRRILFAADQLVNTIKMAQQQAILETSTLGIRFDNSSYQIVKLQNFSQWQPISNKGIFRIHQLPNNAAFFLSTEYKASRGNPEIVINASGDMTPFILNIGTSKDTILTVLKGDHNGSLTFSKAKVR